MIPAIVGSLLSQAIAAPSLEFEFSVFVSGGEQGLVIIQSLSTSVSIFCARKLQTRVNFPASACDPS